MMEKKLINNFFILFLIFILNGCTTVVEEKFSQMNGTWNKNSKSPILLGPVISSLMDERDQVRLKTLVSTAQPRQSTKWISATTGINFKFTSLKIYLNDSGQCCRRYELAFNRFFLIYHKNYDVCRNSQGVWQVIKFDRYFKT